MILLTELYQELLNNGIYLLLPVSIFILGLIFKMKVLKSIRLGATVGIAFIGVRVLIELLTVTLQPIIDSLVMQAGSKLNIVDVGWGTLATLTWVSPYILLFVIIIFVTNLFMLKYDITDTLDVDIWNYHQMAIVGILVHHSTKNLLLALTSIVVMAFITFKLADWTSQDVEEYYSLPNVSLPTMSFLSSFIIAKPLNSILSKIPIIENSKIEIKKFSDKFSIFGEPTILGLVLALLLGVIAKQSVFSILNLGLTLSAVLVLMPKITSLFVEAFLPFTEKVQAFAKTKFKDKNISIGLDAAIILGDSRVISMTVLLIPITIIIAFILPGNSVIPFMDLPVLTFRIALIVAICRGNILKSLIISIVSIILLLLSATATAPIVTSLATSLGIELGSTLISSLAATSLSISFLVYVAFTSNLLISIPLLMILLIVAYRRYEKKYKCFKERKI